MPESVTLLLCQPPTGLTLAERVALIDDVLAIPVGTAHKVAVFPELFLSGYAMSVAEPATACRQDQATLGEIQHRCHRHQCWVVVGAVTHSGTSYRNSALCLAPDGSLHAVHHKCRLFGAAEAKAFEAGDAPVLFDTPLGRTGMAICFDVEDPALIAQYAEQGADWLLTPTANMLPYTLVPTVKVRARALDNGVGIVYANYIGHDNGLDFPGDSIIVDARGGVQGQIGANPGILQVQP